LYYNFAAGSFHTQKLCSRLYSIEIDIYFLKTKIIQKNEKNEKNEKPSFENLGVTYALHV